MLEEGTHGSVSEIAEAEKIDRSYVNRLLRLTLLAPDIEEAIFDGRQPKGMQLEELTRAMPSGWEAAARRRASACRRSTAPTSAGRRDPHQNASCTRRSLGETRPT